MITALTKKQQSKFQKYVETWVKLGLTTKQRTVDEATRDFENFQKIILKKKKLVPVILFESPSKCWNQVENQVWNQVRNQVENQVENQVWNQVWNQVRNQVENQVRNQVENQVENQVWKQVRNQDFIWPYFDCQFWASFFSFYDFMEKELGIKYSNSKEYKVFKACQGYGMVFPLDDLCIVCQPPTQLNVNSNGLHCENGPAVSYNGDNEIWVLNGVIMKKEHILTPANNFNPKEVIKETNVEVRRELIRKIGIEKLINDLPHKLLDKKEDYELFKIELSSEVRNAKFLKMKNPSLEKVWHFEGVDSSIQKVSEALNWRNQNMFETPETLT